MLKVGRHFHICLRSRPRGFTKRTPRILLIICIGNSRYEKHFPLCDVELWTFWMGAFSLDGWMQDWLKGTNARISTFKLYRFSTRCGFPPCRRSTGTRQEQYIELMLAMIEWSGVRKAKIFSCLFLFSWLLFLIKIRICVPVPGEWSGEGQQARIFFSSSVHLYWKIINRKGAYWTAEKEALLIQGSEWSFRRQLL